MSAPGPIQFPWESSPGQPGPERVNKKTWPWVRFNSAQMSKPVATHDHANATYTTVVGELLVKNLD